MAGLTVKQEKFAQRFVELGNSAAAYREVYDVSPHSRPQTAHEEGCRLVATPKVSARISELRAQHADQHAVTVDSLTADFRDAAEFAKRCKNPSALVSALVGLMKLHGLGIEKRELTIKDDVRGMSPEELDRYERQLDVELAALNASH